MSAYCQLGSKQETLPLEPLAIRVRVVTAENAAYARLAEVDENLCRLALTPAEEAVNVAAREKAYCEVHGIKDLKEKQLQDARAAKAAKNGGEDLKSEVRTSAGEGFVTDTVEKTGKKERAVHLAKKRGGLEGIEKLQGTEADKGVVLDAIVAIQDRTRWKGRRRPRHVLTLVCNGLQTLQSVQSRFFEHRLQPALQGKYSLNFY